MTHVSFLTHPFLECSNTPEKVVQVLFSQRLIWRNVVFLVFFQRSKETHYLDFFNNLLWKWRIIRFFSDADWSWKKDFVWMCIVLFLTAGVVLVSTLGENHLQLCETRPGLHSTDEAFQVVQVSGWTEDKQTNKHKSDSWPLWPDFSQNIHQQCDFTSCVCSWGSARVQTDCSGQHTVERHRRTYATCNNDTTREWISPNYSELVCSVC